MCLRTGQGRDKKRTEDEKGGPELNAERMVDE
jgi:hypothetical protein